MFTALRIVMLLAGCFTLIASYGISSFRERVLSSSVSVALFTLVLVSLVF